MTLLEAITTLIDAVKTYAPEEDRTIAQVNRRLKPPILTTKRGGLKAALAAT